MGSAQGSCVPFPTTRWTLVRALSEGSAADRATALDELVRRYWHPIYAVARAMGCSWDSADDLRQSFFTTVVLGRTLFERADPSRGRLRALLRSALRHHLIDSIPPRPKPQQLLEGSDWESDMNRVFDREWARASLEEALRRCERYCHANGLDRHWAAFEAHVVRPSAAAVIPMPLDRLAEELRFASAAHVASALKVVKKRARVMLREVVAETAITAEEQSEEYSWLLSVLS